MWLEEIEDDKNIWNKISILRAAVAAVVVVGKILNDGAVDVVAVGANENVPAVVGFVTEKPNDVPAAVVAAGNNEVEPEEDKSTNQMSFFFKSKYTKTKTWCSCCCCGCRRLITSECKW